MDIPDDLVRALADGRVSHTDVGVYIHLVTLMNGGTVHGSSRELAEQVGVARDTFRYSIGVLQAAGFVKYHKSSTRYVQSTIEIIGLESSPMNHRSEISSDEPVTSEDTLFDAEFSTESTAPSQGRATSKGLRPKNEDPQSSPPSPKFAEDSTEYLLSKKLVISIRKYLDPNRRCDLQEWATHIDKLMRLDGRTADEIDDVIYWLYHSDSQHAQFWRTNILSTRKLRLKFPTMVAQMGVQGRRKRSQPKGEACPTCNGDGHIIIEDDSGVHGAICPDCKGERVKA